MTFLAVLSSWSTFKGQMKQILDFVLFEWNVFIKYKLIGRSISEFKKFKV